MNAIANIAVGGHEPVTMSSREIAELEQASNLNPVCASTAYTGAGGQRHEQEGANCITFVVPKALGKEHAGNFSDTSCSRYPAHALEVLGAQALGGGGPEIEGHPGPFPTFPKVPRFQDSTFFETEPWESCVESWPRTSFNLSKLSNLSKVLRLGNMAKLAGQVAVTPFTSGRLSCYIGSKPRGPVCRSTFLVASAAPNDKRGFVMPKFSGQLPVRILPSMVMGGMGISARTAARLLTCFEHPAHLFRVEADQVASLNPVGAKTMTALNRAHTAAPTSPAAQICASPTTGTPDPIQLHAQAHNAMAMALHYLSQPQANIAAARRKAVQALSALRGLDLSLEG